jgi:hypothetical protein
MLYQDHIRAERFGCCTHYTPQCWTGVPTIYPQCLPKVVCSYSEWWYHIYCHILSHNYHIYYHILATPLSKLYCRCTTLQTNLNHCTDLCSWTLPFGDLGDVAATAQISVILIPAIIAIIAIPCLELEKPREKRIFKSWPFFRGSLKTRSNNDLSQPSWVLWIRHTHFKKPATFIAFVHIYCNIIYIYYIA